MLGHSGTKPKNRYSKVLSNMDQERVAKLEAQVEGIKEDVKEVRDDIKELHSRITTQTREIVDKMDDMQTRLEHKMNAGALAAKQQHEDIQKNIHQDIKEVSDRVDVLERWRWMIVGGAIVVGYIIGHADFFTKFFG